MWQRFRRITLPLLMPALLVALIFRTLDALRIFDLPFVLTKGANGTKTHVAGGASRHSRRTTSSERARRTGGDHVPDRDDRLVPLHPVRRRQHPRTDGGLTWELQPEPPRRRRDHPARSRPSSKGPTGPDAVVDVGRRRGRSWSSACSPFYWLVNVSLKTGPDLSGSDDRTAESDARQLPVDLPERRLRACAGQQRDREPHDDGAGAARGLVLRLRARAPEVQRASSSCSASCCRSRRSRRSRSRRRSSACGPTRLGLYNTLPGLIIPYLTFALPLSIYILVSFFREIPKDLEEAALVDGATHFEAFRKIVSRWPHPAWRRRPS